MHRRLIVFLPSRSRCCWGWVAFCPARGAARLAEWQISGRRGRCRQADIESRDRAGRGQSAGKAGDRGPGCSRLAHLLDHPAGWRPIRSKIKLPPSSDYRLLGDFTVSPPAEVHEYADIWPGLKVEEHTGKVTWQAPIELAPASIRRSSKSPGPSTPRSVRRAAFRRRITNSWLAGGRQCAGWSCVGAQPPGQGGRIAAVPVAPTGEIAGPPAGPERHLSPGTTPEAFKAAHTAIRGRIEPAPSPPAGRPG